MAALLCVVEFGVGAVDGSSAAVANSSVVASDIKEMLL
jgi:hypothetical protein